MMMLPFVFLSVFVLFASVNSQKDCCRLPFTDKECRINRKGPHRYQTMPDRDSGRVIESTECYVNDFNSTYRKIPEGTNNCNDCPGLLILHTNSSEIFLYPEYLERILQGRTKLQRKNVVILTTSLVGSYDLDFTYFSRYYASHPLDEVPSLYVDLQMPLFDSGKKEQPKLRLRLPDYIGDKEGLSKISRRELLDPLTNDNQAMINAHQLPYLYHFDMAKHQHPPIRCTLYDVQLSSTLEWTRLESESVTCHRSASYFGHNRCLATGFTRLFCSIEEHVTSDDQLDLSSSSMKISRVEHLTLAVTGGRHTIMSLSNNQLKPAEQVKVLLQQGHLHVADINNVLRIRVEFGSNCLNFGLTVPAGHSVTQYSRFEGDIMGVHEGKPVMILPSCLKVLPDDSAPLLPIIPARTTIHSISRHLDESDEEIEETTGSSNVLPTIIDETLFDSNLTNATMNEQEVTGKFSGLFQVVNGLAFGTIVLLITAILIPLCLALYYRSYRQKRRKSKWTLEHGSHTNPAFNISGGDRTDVSISSLPSYIDHSTQTENNIRI